MNYEFEWYKPSLGTPIVTIAEYGLIFNKAAIEALNQPSHVKLGFDKDNRLIGVKGCEPDIEEEKTCLPFMEKERQGFVRINNKDFIRFILRYCPDIKLEKALRCLARTDNEILIVDLNQAIEGQDNEEKENYES